MGLVFGMIYAQTYGSRFLYTSRTLFIGGSPGIFYPILFIYVDSLAGPRSYTSRVPIAHLNSERNQNRFVLEIPVPSLYRRFGDRFLYSFYVFMLKSAHGPVCKAVGYALFVRLRVRFPSPFFLSFLLPPPPSPHAFDTYTGREEGVGGSLTSGLTVGWDSRLLPARGGWPRQRF